MFTKICVPVNDEPLSSQAAKAAIGFANKLSASVLFISVYTMPNLHRDESEEAVRQNLEQTAQQLLESLIEMAEQHNILARTLVIEAASHNIASTIAQIAQIEHCDLIAMGTHAREGIGRMLLGSVAEAVTRLSNLPVLLYRSGIVPSLKPFECSNILVAIDAHAASQAALQVTRALARQLPASIEVLHVVPDVPYIYTEAITPMIYDEHLAADFLNKGKHILYNAESVLDDISAKQLVLEPAKNRRISDVILQTADLHLADLIVLGTHGHTGIERLLLGSVAQAVAHHAPVPVLLIRGVALETTKQPVFKAITSASV